MTAKDWLNIAGGVLFVLGLLSMLDQARGPGSTSRMLRSMAVFVAMVACFYLAGKAR